MPFGSLFSKNGVELVQENVITENKNKLQGLLQLEMKDL